MNANGKYTLDGHDAVPCEDIIEWGRWFEKANRTVARTKVGEVEVSTVFLGVDHSFGYGPGPILFETMVFGGDWENEMDRYATWEDAERGHAAMVARVAALPNGNTPATPTGRPADE